VTVEAYAALVAAGALLAAAAAVAMGLRRRWSSLTGWIVVAIGLGVAAGASFQFFAPEMFRADPAALPEGEAIARRVHEFLRDLFLRALQM
jgi:hypothetical protein